MENTSPGEVRMVDFTPVHAQAFKDLNHEWIAKYFRMEDSDYKALDNAQSYIMDNGGQILVALLNDEPIGVVALIKMDDPKYQYELAKMAVSPKAQGHGIGQLLGQAALDRAAQLGANYVYLESNTILETAIRLYHRLGFTEVHGRPTPYERCNIQMEVAV